MKANYSAAPPLFLWIIALLVTSWTALADDMPGAFRVVQYPSGGFITVRSGPGVQHDSVGTIPAKSNNVHVKECVDSDDGQSKKPWCHIYWNNLDGWTSACCITLPAGQYEVAKSRSANMRSGPGVNHDVVTQVPAGSSGLVLTTCATSDDNKTRQPWCQVTWNGNNGWISSCCLIAETNSESVSVKISEATPEKQSQPVPVSPAENASSTSSPDDDNDGYPKHVVGVNPTGVGDPAFGRGESDFLSDACDAAKADIRHQRPDNVINTNYGTCSCDKLSTPQPRDDDPSRTYSWVCGIQALFQTPIEAPPASTVVIPPPPEPTLSRPEPHTILVTPVTTPVLVVHRPIIEPTRPEMPLPVRRCLKPPC